MKRKYTNVVQHAKRHQRVLKLQKSLKLLPLKAQIGPSLEFSMFDQALFNFLVAERTESVNF